MDVTQGKESGESGFSLIEIVIALGLFSLISLAGVVLVGSILQVRGRTEGRLEELGDLQRAMLVIASDFQQARGRSIRVDPAGASLDRAADGGAMSVRYVMDDGAVGRLVSMNGAGETRQILLDQVTAVHWRVFLKDGGWVETWPSERSLDSQQVAENPTPLALSVEFDLGKSRTGVSGTLRRVVELTMPP